MGHEVLVVIFESPIFLYEMYKWKFMWEWGKEKEERRWDIVAWTNREDIEFLFLFLCIWHVIFVGNSREYIKQEWREKCNLYFTRIELQRRIYTKILKAKNSLKLNSLSLDALKLGDPLTWDGITSKWRSLFIGEARPPKSTRVRHIA